VKIDIQRLTALMQGTEEPKTDAEEWFVDALNFGQEGYMLRDLLMEGEILDKLKYDELVMYVVGYAMGQAMYEEEEFINNGGHDTIH